MDLRGVLQVLRTNWLMIVLATAVATALAFGVAMAQPRTYRANASGIVTAGTAGDLGSALAGENLAKSRVKSYLDVARSRAVALRVIEDLRLTTSPDALVAQVTATNPVDTAVIQITASAREPQLAAEIAEAWVRGIAAQIQSIENPGGTATKSVVQFRSLDSAVVPTAPSSPNVTLIMAIGAMVGATISVVVAFVLAILDRRIRRPRQVEESFGLSVLGSIPQHPGLADDRRLVAATTPERPDRRDPETANQSFALTEALRELRTNLRFMDVDHPPRVITITSSLPGEGKSTVAANLALAIAAGGDPVVLVDGDLRRPSVARSFGLPSSVGLTDVLSGQAELDDVVQDAPGIDHLQILGAGPIPPNPSELLGSAVMRRTLAQLSSRALVLVDAPPLLPVTDAAVLSVVTDGALLVGRCGRTTLDAVEQALGTIDRVSGRTLGFIINAVPMRGSRSYTYHYRYHYDHRRHGVGQRSVPTS